MPVDCDRIKELRKKLGYTQEEAAARAGLSSRQHWNNIESGRALNISVPLLEQVARALNTSAKELLK